MATDNYLRSTINACKVATVCYRLTWTNVNNALFMFCLKCVNFRIKSTHLKKLNKILFTKKLAQLFF